MGLTTRNLQSQIVAQDAPHYYELRDPKGNILRCCGTSTDVDKIIHLFPGSTYHKVYPNIPDTVDVSHTNMGEEKSLPQQQILPESQLQTLDL
jgi:hypothetical protein